MADLLQPELRRLLRLLPHQALFDGSRVQSSSPQVRDLLSSHAGSSSRSADSLEEVAARSAHYLASFVRQIGQFIMASDWAIMPVLGDVDWAVNAGQPTLESDMPSGPAPAPAVLDDQPDAAPAPEIGEPMELSDEILLPEDVPQPKPLMAPALPSIEEQRKHALSHVPFQRWRSLCQRAKGKDDPHRRAALEAHDGLPTIQLDYAFLRTSSADDQPCDQPSDHPLVAVLVGIDTWTGMRIRNAGFVQGTGRSTWCSQLPSFPARSWPHGANPIAHGRRGVDLCLGRSRRSCSYCSNSVGDCPCSQFWIHGSSGALHSGDLWPSSSSPPCTGTTVCCGIAIGLMLDFLVDSSCGLAAQQVSAPSAGWKNCLRADLSAQVGWCAL